VVAAALGALFAPFVVYFFGHVRVTDSSWVKAVVAKESFTANVRIIHAYAKSKDMDPRLKDLANELGKLSFSGYSLIDEALLEMEIGSVDHMQLPTGEWIGLKALDISADRKLKLEVEIDKLRTTVVIESGSTRIVDGPAMNGESLILAITRSKE